MTEQAQSKVRFTPGPWTQNFDEQFYCPDSSIIVGSVDEGRFRETCIVTEHDCDTAEAKANARLIAAAPDMLKALHDIFAVGDGYKKNSEEAPAGTTGEGHARCREIARAALAKVNQP